jgi:glycosyltransferase involved in cell wall biosynthesis
MGALKIMDFISKSTYDLIRSPTKTIRTMNCLIRTHSSIFSISDTYLGFRKIRTRPDLIHVQFPHLNHLYQARFLSESFDCPFTLTFRALDLYEKTSERRLKLKQKIIRKAAAIITISKQNREVVRDRFGIDAVVVHSAINLDKFHPDERERAREGSANLIFIGRFVQKKGVKYLLKACEILKNDEVKFHLNLFGEGPLRKEYERMIRGLHLEGLISIKGLASQEDLIESLKRSDVLVLPSVILENGDRDILSNSLKEAMAMNVPVLTSDISGIEELVKEGWSGLLVKPGDINGISSGIKKLLSDPDLRKELGKNGREKVLSDFNIKIEAKKLNGVFLGVIERTHKNN